MTKNGGYTLVEVVISIMLTAVMVSSVLSVALSTKESGGKADRKLLGNQAVTALTEVLKGYVTGDTSNTTINGPNFHNRGAYNVNTWHIHTPGVQEDHQCSLTGSFGGGAPSIGAVQDIYALASASSSPAAPGGLHCLVCVAGTNAGADAGCFLPKVLRDPPYNGTIFYQVTGGSGSAPQVQVGVWWDEP